MGTIANGGPSGVADKVGGLLAQTQEQLVNTQGKMIEAAMTMQEPVADALRKVVAMFAGLISTSEKIAPLEKLLEFQFNLIQKTFDFQLGLVNMMFDTKRESMKREQPATPTTAASINLNVIDLERTADSRLEPLATQGSAHNK